MYDIRRKRKQVRQFLYWKQTELSLMLGLRRAYEMFTSWITTIHTTHVQETGRKDVNVSSCLLARNTRTVHGSGHEYEGKGSWMKFNLDSLLRTAIATQDYHGCRYIIKAHEMSESQLARGRADTGYA